MKCLTRNSTKQLYLTQRRTIQHFHTLLASLFVFFFSRALLLVHLLRYVLHFWCRNLHTATLHACSAYAHLATAVRAAYSFAWVELITQIDLLDQLQFGGIISFSWFNPLSPTSKIENKCLTNLLQANIGEFDRLCRNFESSKQACRHVWAATTAIILHFMYLFKLKNVSAVRVATATAAYALWLLNGQEQAAPITSRTQFALFVHISCADSFLSCWMPVAADGFPPSDGRMTFWNVFRQSHSEWRIFGERFLICNKRPMNALFRSLLWPPKIRIRNCRRVCEWRKLFRVWASKSASRVPRASCHTIFRNIQYFIAAFFRFALIVGSYNCMH